MKILGAGLAGCLAGAMNPKATILEPYPKRETHKALLRFRSDKIGRELGIPFQQVKVYKGIWHNDSPVSLSPRYIALYSRKVSDTVSYRSICNLDTEIRYIAPNNLHDILCGICGDRIEYEADDWQPHKDEVTISTLPIDINAKLCSNDIDVSKSSSTIYVSQFKIQESNVFMTYYYTDPTVHMYRASITNDVLIIESMWQIEENDIKVAFRSFGLQGLPIIPILVNHRQTNGKIVPIDEGKRKTLLYEMTTEYNLYSLGRFATWREKVLLDDVFDDILKIRNMIGKHKYDRHKEL